MFNFIKALVGYLKGYIDKKILNSKADWNESDENADSYVKNRTHWIETVPAKTLVDNLTPDLEEWPTCNFVPGRLYNVIWNGTLYENIECINYDGFYCITDTIGDFDNCTFYIDDNGGNGLYIDQIFSSVSIIENAHEEYHTIDKEFLPIGELSLKVNLSIINNDDGSLSATSDKTYDDIMDALNNNINIIISDDFGYNYEIISVSYADNAILCRSQNETTITTVYIYSYTDIVVEVKAAYISKASVGQFIMVKEINESTNVPLVYEAADLPKASNNVLGGLYFVEDEEV